MTINVKLHLFQEYKKSLTAKAAKLVALAIIHSKKYDHENI